MVPPIWLDVAAWLILASFFLLFAYMAWVAARDWRHERAARRQRAGALIVTTYATSVDADTMRRHLDALHRIADQNGQEVGR